VILKKDTWEVFIKNQREALNNVYIINGMKIICPNNVFLHALNHTVSRINHRLEVLEENYSTNNIERLHSLFLICKIFDSMGWLPIINNIINVPKKDLRLINKTIGLYHRLSECRVCEELKENIEYTEEELKVYDAAMKKLYDNLIYNESDNKS
jgi:hypothetical protein